MPLDLTVRASDARELMDDSLADTRKLERTYAQFALVNTAVSRWRRVYVSDIRPRARETSIRILDVGAGGADLSRAVARWLRRDGLSARVIALDTDERAMAWAAAHAGGEAVEYRSALLSDLVSAGESYDVVLSNHVLHHLAAAELPTFLSDSQSLARTGGLVAHHDIERSALAYRLFAMGTWPFLTTLLADSFIRDDGLTSIRRSYTAAELADRVPGEWTVNRRLPARLELRWQAPSG